MPGQPVKIGPFVGGMNTYSGPTSIDDNEAVSLVNVDIDLDGTVLSRPPFDYDTAPVSGSSIILGVYRSTTDVVYIVYAFATAVYVFNTSTLAWTNVANVTATACVQYNDKLYIVQKPSGITQGGQSWDPIGGTVAVATMPRGYSACIYKERMFISASRTSNEDSINRVKFSNPADPATWGGSDFFDVSAGDGQDITKLFVFDSGIIIFKSDSTYNFAYESAPTRGQVQQVSSKIGANNDRCVVEYENNLFVLHEANVYRISNWNWEHANIKVPFEYRNQFGITLDISSSIAIVGNRLICRYYDNYYNLGLKTGAWSKWEFRPPRTNYLINGNFEVDMTGWDASGVRDTTVSFIGVASAKVDATAAVKFFSKTADFVTVADGETVTVSCWIKGTGQATLRIRSTALGTSIHGFIPATTLSGQWERMTVTAVAPAGTVSVEPDFLIELGAVVNIDGVMIEKSSTANEDYYEGLRAYTPGNFVENPNIDISTGNTVHYAGSYVSAHNLVYTFTNTVSSVVERIDVSLSTKVYDFGPSYAFKRLFWWGVDLLSKAIISFKVIPVAYQVPVTWGQIALKTWEELNTWGQPLDVALDVSDSISSNNPTGYRIFVKLLKSLRFRQLQFKLDSTLDGTSESGPLRIFSLTASVDSKETVVKKAS